MAAPEPLILVTNDDGVHAEGIGVLARALARIGRVVTVAPDREQSAASHAVTLHRPLRVREIGGEVIAVQGTPTDCVMMAVQTLLGRHPDVVVSGINDGPNLGDDVNYSGTVAAAKEGSLLGVPSIAISLGKEEGRDYEAAAAIAAQVARAVLARQAPYPPESDLPADAAAAEDGGGAPPPARSAARVVLNVNVPGGPPARIRGTRLTRLGRRIYRDAIVEKTDPRGQRYYWIGGSPTWIPEHEDGLMTDFTAVRQGYVSITPLRMDITDYDGLRQLADWGLEG